MSSTVPTPETEPQAAESRYCFQHPERETRLSCGNCQRQLCEECSTHTSAGLRCFACGVSTPQRVEVASTDTNDDAEPSSAAQTSSNSNQDLEQRATAPVGAATSRARTAYLAGLISTLLLAFVMPPLVVLSLLAAVALAYRTHLPAARHLAGGLGYFFCFWLLVVPPLLQAAGVYSSKGLSGLETSGGEAFIGVLGGLLAWPFLLLPAQECASALQAQGRALRAGICAGAGIAATALCLGLAGLFLALGMAN